MGSGFGSSTVSHSMRAPGGLEDVAPFRAVPQEPNDVMARYRSTLVEYLNSDEIYPCWQPSNSYEDRPTWHKTQREYLTQLQIPKLDTAHGLPDCPDLLLYCLGSLSDLDPGCPARLRDFTSGDNHILLVNASGTGKTRLVFETLTRQWGFYFTCSRDIVGSPYGSSDLSDALHRMGHGVSTGRSLTWFIGPPSRSTKDMELLSANRHIAEAVFRRVLLARFLVFELVQSLLPPHRDDLRARKQWLLLQLRSDVILGCDIFATISRLLMSVPDSEVNAQLLRISSSFADLLEFIAIDEAQVADAKLGSVFATQHGHAFAPVLREFIVNLHISCPRQRIIVSGTRVHEDVLSEALHSCGATRRFALFCDLGQFDSLGHTRYYLKHFFADFLSDTHHAEAFRWMRGRRRFMTVFVYHILATGPSRFDAVLDMLVSCLSGHERRDEDTDWIDDTPYNLIAKNEFLEDCFLARHLREALFAFALRREASSFSDNALAFADVGLGLLAGRTVTATVCEPLVFYRLLGWMLKSRRHGIAAILNERLCDDSLTATGMPLAAGCAACLWNTFSVSGCRLDGIARFEGPIIPCWTAEDAVLVLPPSVHLSERTRDAECTVPDVYSIAYARTPEEVALWVSSGKSPFLIPDDQLDADLLFFVRIPPGTILLVMLHLEPFSCTRPRRKRTIVPPDPSMLYRNSRADHGRFLSALNALPPAYFDQQRHRPVRYNIFNLTCFTRPYRQHYDYNPPVACLDIARVLQNGHAPELDASLLDIASLETVV